ncbi:hypothetical protein [Rubellimicrobium arenae]|nr:hypothetical protein [Rubellimicrobium arenae]
MTIMEIRIPYLVRPKRRRFQTAGTGASCTDVTTGFAVAASRKKEG